MKCPCCKSKGTTFLKFPEPHFFCAACHHRRKSLKPRKNYYKELSGRSKMFEKDLKRKNAERIKFLRRYLKDGARVLEIGCAEGFLGERVKRAFKVSYCGIEPSRDAETAAARLNEIWKSVEKVPSGKNFDLILSFHTLEHIDDIERTMSMSYKMLDDKGVIVAEVPCYFGNKLLPWDYSREHVHIFSPVSMACLFARYGFGVRNISTGHFESAIYNDSLRITAVKIKKTDELKNNLIKSFTRRLGRRYVIYGAGGDFESLVRPYLQVAGISAIIDSSEEKIGKNILGKAVQGPEALADYPSEKILIATYRYQAEIIKTLKKRGIKKTRLVTLADILTDK